MTDWTLLRDYFERGSEKAFEGLVQRHVNMVYATALRQSKDPELAKDITQAVFVLLVRKGKSLASTVNLSGWLYKTTNFVTQRAIRDAFRRKQRESESVLMGNERSGNELWESVAPHLDAAVSNLNAADRLAVILRFLEQRSFREVGESLGVTEDAAKKRVGRALEKLRAHLVARGTTLSVSALTALLMSDNGQAAPAGVAASASQAAAAAGAHATPAAIALAGAVARQWFLVRLGWIGGVTSVCLALLVWLSSSPGTSQRNGTDAHVAETPAEINREAIVVDEISSTVAHESTNRSIKLLVVAAETGAPITNAVVDPALYGNSDLNIKQFTDAKGSVRFQLPIEERFHGMVFWVSAPGRVPSCVRWKRSEALLIPDEYLVKMVRGKTVSGKVIDEQMQPVVGAALHFDGEGINDYSREYVDYRTVQARTADDGTWTADFLVDNTGFSGAVRHPDFAETDFTFDLKTNSNPVIVIKRGGNVTGVVTDTAGVPIKGAVVAVDWQHSMRKKLKTVTDDYGRFELQHIGENTRSLTNDFRFRVEAQNHTVLEKLIVPEAVTMHLEVVLELWKPAGNNTISGHVTDDSGKPLRGVDVALAPNQSNLDGIEWSTKTEVDGRFTWTNAPATAVKMSFRQDFFMPITGAVMQPGEDNTVILKRSESIDLRIVATDEETGLPISRFMVRRGQRSRAHAWAAKPVSLDYMGEGKDGEFVARFSPGEFGGISGSDRSIEVLQIEAKGYVAAILEFPQAIQASTNIAISLTSSREVTGKVLLPSGQPASGAQIGLTGDILLTLEPFIEKPAQFRVADRQFVQQTIADPDGVFRFSPEHKFKDMLIVHDGGWAKLAKETIMNRDTVHLRPWGRIEGVLRVGNNPGVGETVGAHQDTKDPASMDSISFGYHSEPTDEQGRFTFEKVPPGAVKLIRWGPVNGVSAMFHVDVIYVEAGQTTKVQFGGKGVRVTGRLKTAPERDDIAWGATANTLAAPDKRQIHHQFICNADGTFTIEDVLPGSYQLQARANIDKSPNEPHTFNRGRYQMVGDLITGIVIPNGTTETFDIGVITIPTKPTE